MPLTLVLAACVGAHERPAVHIPSDVVPAMRSVERPLRVNDIAEDAIRPVALGELLERSGFRSAAERVYTGERRDGVIVVRLLSFASADGSGRYLAWLREHADQVLGSVSVETIALRGERLPAFVHLPGGCCAKATPTYLVGWRSGSRAITVRLAGPGATLADLEAVAGRVAEAM